MKCHLLSTFPYFLFKKIQPYLLCALIGIYHIKLGKYTTSNKLGKLKARTLFIVSNYHNLETIAIITWISPQFKSFY